MKSLGLPFRGIMEVRSQNLPGETEEDHENSVRITNDPAEIQTEHPPNTSPNRHL
jgi:hypothetical protein